MTTGDYIVSRRNSAYVPGTLVSIEGYSPDDILEGYEVQEYDLSLEAGRNASGTMHLNYIATKYKVILKTSPAYQGQLASFYNSIPRRAISVTFFNPFTNGNYTMQAYRGDRKVTMIQDQEGVDKLYDSTEQSLIEL